ncbi:RGCVC family protein [Actinocrinis sp.]|uniref:RGCVC family protein n=1 Tax=Actinocrinis sp. TaxID=1920516 RepID=UPI002D70E17E|nr:RGCVC family protein [Actinocrinis sp.]HZP52691.1 RGCVC family protein [Actinocrinis sp.]
MPLSVNNHVAATTVSIQVDPAEQLPPANLCTCGHPYSQHDRISIRYCDATVTGGLDRGCICRTGTGTYAGRM